MIVSVHQPQYLPWLGYFHKISNSDAFVFLDNVQYKKREYQNRNRIRTRDGCIWLTVPVSHERSFPNISDVFVDNSQGWHDRHWKTLSLNYADAKFFDNYRDIFEKIYSERWERLVELNMHIIKSINSILGIDKSIYLESQLNIKTTQTQRIIDICKTLKADTYLSGAGGRKYLDEGLFARNGLKLVYQKFKHPEYTQRYEPFMPYMSIVDLLFNCGDGSMKVLSGAGL